MTTMNYLELPQKPPAAADADADADAAAAADLDNAAAASDDDLAAELLAILLASATKKVTIISSRIGIPAGDTVSIAEEPRHLSKKPRSLYEASSILSSSTSCVY